MKPVIPRRKKHSPLAFLVSLIIHVGIALLVIGSVGFVYHSATKKQPVAVHKPVLQAVAMNQKEIQSEINSIKANRLAKKEKQIKWQQHLEKMAQAAVTQRQTAEKVLKRLQTLQQAAAQRLQALKTHQQQLSAQNQSINKKLLATEMALQQQQTEAKKLALQNELIKEKAKQKEIAKQQMIDQIARYKTLILNNIGQEWIIPQGANPALSCQLLVRLNANGVVKNVRLLKSSGDPVLDRSAITAVYKASPLPVPKNISLFKQFAELKLTVKPEGLLTQ